MKKWLLVLAIAGLLFSGYLSAVKFFSNSCALGETCPYFIGLPACYFGFGMYVAITYLAIKGMYKSVFGVAVAGIIFAGYFTIIDLPRLTSCSLGWGFYIAIAVVSYKLSSKWKKE
jgi:hypothetical protein